MASGHASFVSELILVVLPRYLFSALLNNYNRFVGNTEHMSETEKQETWSFMRAISSTGPIKELHKYLVKKELAPTSMVYLNA